MPPKRRSRAPRARFSPASLLGQQALGLISCSPRCPSVPEFSMIYMMSFQTHGHQWRAGGVNISHYRGKKMAGRMISTTLSRFTLLTCLGGAQQGCTLWPFQWGSSGGPAGNRRKRMDALEQLAQKKGPAGKCRRHGRPRGPCGSRLIKMFPSCLFICSLVAPLPRSSVTRF